MQTCLHTYIYTCSYIHVYWFRKHTYYPTLNKCLHLADAERKWHGMDTCHIAKAMYALWMKGNYNQMRRHLQGLHREGPTTWTCCLHREVHIGIVFLWEHMYFTGAVICTLPTSPLAARVRCKGRGPLIILCVSLWKYVCLLIMEHEIRPNTGGWATQLNHIKHKHTTFLNLD